MYMHKQKPTIPAFPEKSENLVHSDSYMATMGRYGVAVALVIVLQKLGLLTPHHCLTLWLTLWTFSFANPD